jgi:hypothetical protein
MNEKFSEAMKEWDKVTMELLEYGAADSEPTRMLEHVIGKKINEDLNLLPLKAGGWELYDVSDSELAAGILNEAAQEIIDVLDSLKYSEVKAIADYYGF